MISAEGLTSVVCFDIRGNALRTPRPADVAAAWAAILQAAPNSTHEDQVAMAATVAVECGSFIPQRERRANPKTQPQLYALQDRYWSSGYMGRGFLQLTWRRNYEACGKALGLDLLATPDLLLSVEVSAKALVWYFESNRIFESARKKDWEAVRRKVNGGLSGWAAFIATVNRLEALA